ncbi:MAG TPA: nickel insertion protein, partial [Capsulimonadaceae bacterium]|nr:nickel insertion protein [Capsulimonadaceae bacterium]
MKIAHFDCFSGISGDMALAALLDAGASETLFREQLAGLQVPGYELKIQRVKREGIAATDVDVRLIKKDQGHGRHLSDITAILRS